MSKKSKKSKTVKVDRKFLTNLANEIYSSRNRTFLRLCNGVLQNGPDPTDERRPMHCGLGELYFAMTGLQPEETGVDEGDVVNLALELSPLAGVREANDAAEAAKLDDARDAIKKLDVDDDLKDVLLGDIDDAEPDVVYDEDRDDDEFHFRAALDEIPGINDDGCDDGSCSIEDYRERSKRVAAQLKEAASYLPR